MNAWCSNVGNTPKGMTAVEVTSTCAVEYPHARTNKETSIRRSTSINLHFIISVTFHSTCHCFARFPVLPVLRFKAICWEFWQGFICSPFSFLSKMKFLNCQSHPDQPADKWTKGHRNSGSIILLFCAFGILYRHCLFYPMPQFFCAPDPHQVGWGRFPSSHLTPPALVWCLCPM